MKTTILNSQSIRMLQTHVDNDIYNKYCLIHNNGYDFLHVVTCYNKDINQPAHRIILISGFLFFFLFSFFYLGGGGS